MISKVFFLSADLNAQINVFRSMYVETLQSRHLCQFLQTKSACTLAYQRKQLRFKTLQAKRGLEVDLFKKCAPGLHAWPHIFPKDDLII